MKKRSARKLSAAILAVMLAVMMVISGCSNNDSGGNTGSSGSTESTAVTEDNTSVAADDSGETAQSSSGDEVTTEPEPVDLFGKFDPPITVTAARILTSWMTFDEGEDETNNWWMRTFSEELGINVEWAWTAPNWGEPYEQKVNMAIATNDLPDFMCVYGSIFKQLVDAGKLEDLTETYEKYASPYLKENLEADNALIKTGGTIGGQLMAIGLPDNLNSSFQTVLIRKDWLENLNLPVPSTYDELIETAVAFTTQDPDQNGKPDTYGFAFDKELRIDQFYEMLDVKRGWYEKDGELVPWNLQEDTKAAWQTFADWYKMGILSNEFPIKDVNNELVQDMINGKFGIKMGGSPADPQMQDQHKLYPESDWVSIPMPSINGGVAKQMSVSQVGDFNVMTNGSNTEAGMKMLNLMIQCYAIDKPEFVTNYYYHITDQGSLSFFMAPFRMSPRDISRPNILLAREYINEGKDPSTLPFEANSYYDDIYKYENGTPDEKIEKWGPYSEYKEGGANDMRWKYMDEGYRYFDEKFWLATSEEAEFGGGLSTRYQELAIKAIIEDDVENQWNLWIDYYMKNGGTELIAANNAEWKANR